MSQLNAVTAEVSPSAPLRRGRPLLAWFLILAAVGFILWRYSTANSQDRERYDLVTMRLQGRYLVGIAELEERLLKAKKSGREQLYEAARKELDRGTYAQRLRFVVLADDLKGPNEAREQLQEINEKYRAHCGNLSPENEETARILDHLFALRTEDAQEASSLPEDEQHALRQRLDWFGDLALAPPDGDAAARAKVLAPAVRTVWALLGAGVFMLGLGLVGLVLLVTLVVLYFLNRLQSGLASGSPHHGIYAETFALYMLLFLALSFAAHYAINWLSLKHGTWALSGLAALGSLSALAWPVLRGIRWRQVRQDIGWHFDRWPGLEPLLGLGCYALALPMLILGIICLLLLTKLRDSLGWGPDEFGPTNAPGHPIVFSVSQAGWWVWLEVVFVASIVAPIVEETMFRGVLYRHLRAASARWRPAWSAAFSAMLVNFLFAVIHPQGFLAVPALMFLALAFTLMREWRGTLLPSMIAHGINNGVATLLLFLMN